MSRSAQSREEGEEEQVPEMLNAQPLAWPWQSEPRLPCLDAGERTLDPRADRCSCIASSSSTWSNVGSRSQGWHRCVGDSGDVLAVERFGTSAPGKVGQVYGFTVDNICARVRALERNT